MPNIKMPDGQVVNFPDDMAPDDIRGAVSSRFPDISQPEGNMLGKVMEFGSAMGKNIKGAAMQGVGGVARTWGETNQLDKLIVDPEWSAADNPPTELQNKVAKWGQEFGDAGAKISNDERRKYADSWGAGVAMDVTGALAQSSPGLIAGLATRSAQVGLAAFTPQVWGMQYGESRREGKSIAEAMHETRFKTSMEVGTELIPLKWAIGPGKTAMKRILDVTVGEGIQEALNEFMNAGYDAGVYDDKTPMSKAMGDWLMSSDTYKNAGYAAFIGSIAGGAMGAAAHPFVPSNEKMVGQALDKMITGTPQALVGANYDALGMGPGGGPVNIRPGSNPSWNEGSAFNPNMPAGVKESFADGLASMDQSVGDAAIHTDSPLHSQAFDDMAPLIPIMPLIDRFGSADPVMANVASVRVTGEPLKVSDDVLAAMGRAESDINLKRPAVAEVADEMWRIASPEFNPSQKGYKVYVHAGAHMIEDPEVMTDVATFDTEFAARTYMHLVKARAEVMPEAMGMPEPELILQTDTPEFKSWFGDSQVTSSEGAPMVVWHGSPVHDFDVFDTGKINSNDPDAPYNGFWFSTKKSSAKSAGDFPWGRPNANGQVRPFYLRMKNPATKEDIRAVREKLGRIGNDEMRAELERRGFDGVIHDSIKKINRKELENTGSTTYQGKELVVDPESGAVDMYEKGIGYITGYADIDNAIDMVEEGTVVVFNPEQIKSADNNTGEFNPDDLSAFNIKPVSTLLDVTATLPKGYYALQDVPLEEESDLFQAREPRSILHKVVGNYVPKNFEAEIINSSLNRIVKQGMYPASLVDLPTIVITDQLYLKGQEAGYMTLWPTISTIGIRSDFMQEMMDNPDKPHVKQAFDMALAHELTHMMDFGSTDSSFAYKHPDMVLDTDGITYSGTMIDAKAGALGPVMEEALIVFIGDNQLERHLSYPFSDLRQAVMTNDFDLVRHIQRELFAQIGALYFTSPALVKERMPLAFAMMERMHATVQAAENSNAQKPLPGYVQGAGKYRGLQNLPGFSQSTGEGARHRGQRLAARARSGRPAAPTVEHRRLKSGKNKGNYVGASTRYNNPNKIPALRRLLRRLVEDGFAFKGWYRDSAMSALRAVGGDMVQAEKIIQLLAIFSPSNKVGGNTTAAIKAYHQWRRGEKIVAGRYGPHAENANKLMYSGEDWDGRKTNSFYINLMTELDPTALERLYVRDDGTPVLIGVGDAPKVGWLKADSPVTVDMWIARIFDYPTDSVGTAQYHFAELEVKRIAAEYGISPHEAQAAMWVAFNGLWQQTKGGKPEGRPARTKSRNKAVKAELDDSWAESGGVSFATYLNYATEITTWEAMPSTLTPIGAALVTMSYNQKVAYTEASLGLIYDGATDLLAEEIGMPFRWTMPSVGAYDNTLSPNVLTGAVADMTTYDNKPTTYDEKMVDLYSLAIQYIYTQDAVPWFRPDHRAKGDWVHGGVALKFHDDLTTEDLDYLLFVLRERVHPDIGFTKVDSAQVAIINFREEQENRKKKSLVGPSESHVVPSMLSDKDFYGKIEEVIADHAEVLNILDAHNIRAPGNYHGNWNQGKDNWSTDPKGLSLEAEIRKAGGQHLLPWLRNRRRRALELGQEYAGQEVSLPAFDQGAGPRKRVNTRTDNIRQAIIRLGGISKEQAIGHQIDYQEQIVGVGTLVRQKAGDGRDLDDLAMVLDDYGYPVQNEAGEYDPNILAEIIRTGDDARTPAGEEFRMEQEAEDREADYLAGYGQGVGTQPFTAWFKDSKAVDETGEPIILYHGTMSSFDVFDRNKGQTSGDWGRGFHFTNTSADMSENYAGLGPDITNKIERSAEAIADDILDGNIPAADVGLTAAQADPDRMDAVAMDKVRQAAFDMAKDEIADNDGVGMPVYLSLQNPVIIGMEGETYFDYTEEYDEETDEYEEPTGLLVDLIEAVRSVAYEFDDINEKNIGNLVAQLFGRYPDGAKASEIEEWLRNSGDSMSATDKETGEPALGEFIRRVFEETGFDGIIDRTVATKFGPDRRYGKSMEGMDYDTFHYIAFEPNQIKSAVGNKGTFDPDSLSVLEQGAGGISPPPINPPPSGGQDGRGIRGLYANAAEAVIAWGETILAPITALGRVPFKRRYMKTRQAFLGKLARIKEVSDKLSETFEGLDKEASDAVYAFLTDPTAVVGSIPNRTVTLHERGRKRGISLRKRSMALKRLFNQIGDALVEEDLIPMESSEKFRDMYLPRIYLKHLLEGKSGVGGARMSKGERYKKRDDVPESWRRIMGEITDPAYLASVGVTVPLRDMEIIRFLRDISNVKEWVVPEHVVDITVSSASGQVRASQGPGKVVSVYWLEHEADRYMKLARHMTGRARAEAEQYANDLLDIFNEVDKGLPSVDPKQYKQVPDTRQYGPIRGLWIHKQIFEDVFPDQQKSAFPRLEALTRAWKVAKVPMNYPTVVRNLLSNTILMNMGGVPVHRIPQRLQQALREMSTNGKHWRIARKYGITSSTFTANELYELDRDFTRLMARNDISAADGLPLWKIRNMFEAIVAKHTNFYQGSEAIFKTALIIDAMESQGLDEVDAILAANDALFDYSLLPKWAASLRKNVIGIPFLTFYYKSLGQTARAALRRPHLIAGYYAFWVGLQEITKAANDIDDEDLEILMASLPRWLQEKGHAWFIPVRDENGRWQALDVGYLLPWAVHAQTIRNLLKGEMVDALEETGFLGSPVATLISASMTGIDPFTQQEIRNEADQPSKQFWDVMQYMWRLSMPTYMTDMGAVGHIYRASTDKLDTRRAYYGQPTSTMPQALLRAVGINLYPVDPSSTRAANILRFKYEIDDHKGRMRRRIKQLSLTPGAEEERKEIVQFHTNEILKIQADYAEYAAKSKPSERLLEISREQ